MAKIRKDFINNIKDRYIHLFLTVNDFIEGVKEKPKLIFKHFDYRYALERLSRTARKGTQDYSKAARVILMESGLQAFIPKNSHHRKTEDFGLNFIQNNEVDLFMKVREISDKAKPIWDKYHSNNRDKAIREIVKEHFGNYPDDDLFDYIDDLATDLTNIALAIYARGFFSLTKNQAISTDAINKFYYKIHKYYFDKDVANRRKIFFERKLVDIKKLIPDNSQKPVWKKKYNFTFDKVQTEHKSIVKNI